MKIKCKICQKEIERYSNGQKYCEKCAITINKQGHKEYRENNKEYYKEYKQRWFQQNRERLTKKNKEYIKKNPEKAKNYQKKYYEKVKNIPSFKIKQKKWNSSWQERNKERIIEKRKTEEYKKRNKEHKKKERQKYPERIRSRQIADNNIPIKYDKLCELCNINLATERHHEDYSKPLEVMFLCMKCHKLKHSKIIAEVGTLDKLR